MKKHPKLILRESCHVRRYDKDVLLRLLEDAGVGDIRIVNYGFPITEVTRRLSNWMIRNDRSYEGMTPQQRSIRSAQTKPKIINRILAPISDNMFVLFNVMQRWFYRRDWGDGYVACGIKRNDA